MMVAASQERIPSSPDLGISQVVITLPGEIDMSNAGQVHGALVHALDAGAAVLIADAVRTTFCDSATITMLLRAHDQAAATAAQLRIAASPELRRVLELTGADHRLHIYPTVAAALAAPPHGPLSQSETSSPAQ